MSLYHIIGIAIIIICTLSGLKKGFVKILGSICAAILTFSVFWIIRTWAFESFLATLLFEHTVLIVRVVLCVVIYLVLFLLLNAVFMSLKFIARLPIISGLNKLLGMVAGFAYGLLLVGIMTLLYQWIFHIG